VRRLGWLAVVLGAVVGLLAVRGSLAAYDDQAGLTTGTVTAAKLDPVNATCANKGGLLGILQTVELTWANLSPNDQYAWAVQRVSDGAQVSSGTVAASTGASVTLDLSASLLSLSLGGVNLTVSITPQLSAATGWTGPSRTIQVSTVNLLVGLSMQCGKA